MPTDRGFEELAHTADWALRVWAPDPARLFAEAARGMYALAGVRPATGPVTRRIFETSGPDLESLLVAFLSELVFAVEQERLAFTRLQVETFARSDSWALKSEMEGMTIVSIDKAIKAVTYHNLHISKSARGYEVEIVFDV
jgi:SHS2 domain-containing protein